VRRSLFVIAVLALVLTACGGSGSEGVASLQDPKETDTTLDGADAGATNEEAVLAFAQCMRDQGVEGFQDPIIGEDGSVGFAFGGPGGPGDEDGGPFGGVDQDTVQAAFEACGQYLQGVAFGPGGGDFDPSEIQDTMVEFAACLREHGVQVDDPDFSNTGPDVEENDSGDGGPVFSSPFGEDFDPSDPEVQAAIEACQDVIGDFGPPGGARVGPGAGDGGDS
jgi:hypothetical protein